MDFTFTPDWEADLPLYEQIYRYAVAEIRAGRLAEGDKLPSRRRLAEHLGVSLTTVERAYGLLTAEGYIQSVPRSGWRVCPELTLEEAAPPSHLHVLRSTPAAPPRSALNPCFSTGAVDTSVFPFSSWARLTREAVYENPDLLQRGHPQGDLGLREALCAFLHQYRGAECTPEQVVVGAGMEYLLDLLLQLLPSDTAYALEDPGYHATYRALENQGRRIIPIPVDGDGMDVAALAASPAGAAYVTPSHQFPLGVTMPMARRTALLRWAYEGAERYLIEDDYDSEFRYASRPIPALQGLDRRSRVIYVGTFSRSIAPSIRVAYLVLPPALLDVYHRKFSYAASTVSRFEQEVLRRFLISGQYARHLRRSGSLYKARRAALVRCLEALPGGSVSGSEAGLHLLFSLEGRGERELVEAAGRAGYAVRGLSEYCHVATARPGTLVLGFAGLPETSAPAAVAALAAAWRL